MCSVLLITSSWLQTHDFLALWLEGIALVAIFIWDRIDSHQQHKQTLAQMDVMRRQADIMEGQLAIPHRAYLAVGQPQKPIGDEARFPIENYGRVAGRITSVSVEILVHLEDGKELFRRNLTKDADVLIIPGKANAYALSVYLPGEAESGQVLISGEIDYDTGFKSTDKLSFVRVYLRKSSEWVTASWAIEVDFRGNSNKQV